MSFYLEDDDELRQLRERFMQSAPAGAAQGGNPYGAPPRELDPRALQSFLAQKQEPTQRPYPIPQREQGLGVADWFPLAAAGLDLAFNRGRGMGSIAQSAAGMAQRRDAMQAQQFEDDRRAYLAQGEAEARNRQIDLHGMNADMRQQEIDLQREHQRAVMQKFLAQNSPEAQAAELRLKQAMALKAEKEAALDPNAVDPYKQQLIEESKARTESMRNQPKGDSPELAYRKERDAKEDAAEAKKAEEDAAEQKALLSPFAGTNVDNNDLWKAAALDKVQRRRLADGVAAYQSAIRGLSRMQEIRDEFGTEATASAPLSEYDTLKNEVMAAIGVAANAGVLQPSDIDRFRQQIPELGPKLNDVMRLGGTDPTLESLRGTGDALRGSANVKSRAYGFTYDYNDPVFLTDRQLQKYQQALLERQKAAAQAAPQPSAAMPEPPPMKQYPTAQTTITDEPLNLGTTGTTKLRQIPTIDTNDKEQDPYLRRYRIGGFDLRRVQ